MNDLIDFALLRHGKLAEAIQQREADIERLRKERDSLEEFVSRAQEIAELAASERASERQSPRLEQGANEPAPEKDVIRRMPVRPARPA